MRKNKQACEQSTSEGVHKNSITFEALRKLEDEVEINNYYYMTIEAILTRMPNLILVIKSVYL